MLSDGFYKLIVLPKDFRLFNLTGRDLRTLPNVDNAFWCGPFENILPNYLHEILITKFNDTTLRGALPIVHAVKSILNIINQSFYKRDETSCKPRVREREREREGERSSIQKKKKASEIKHVTVHVLRIFLFRLVSLRFKENRISP